MKNISITLVLLALMALPAFSQRAKRIDEVVGSYTDTLADGVDSTGVRTGNIAMDKKILVKFRTNQMYDAFMGTIYVPNMTTVGGAAAGGVGNVDTTIIFIRVGYPYHGSFVLFVDTLYPPDSAFFKFGLDDVRAGAATIYGDSTAALYLPDTTGTEWSLMNNIWYTAFSMDSSGTNPADTADDGTRQLTITMNHYFRFFEWFRD
jgi:hypothetical protein